VRTKDLFWSQKTAKWGLRWVEEFVLPKLFGPKKFQYAYTKVTLAALLAVLGCSAGAAAATTTICGHGSQM